MRGPREWRRVSHQTRWRRTTSSWMLSWKRRLWRCVCVFLASLLFSCRSTEPLKSWGSLWSSCPGLFRTQCCENHTEQSSSSKTSAVLRRATWLKPDWVCGEDCRACSDRHSLTDLHTPYWSMLKSQRTRNKVCLSVLFYFLCFVAACPQVPCE